MSDNYNLIIYSEGKEAGYIRGIIKEYGSQFPFIEYFIIKKYRQKGLINEYFMPFLDELRKNGVKAVLAEVLKNNKISEHILKKHGFINVKSKNKTANAFVKILVNYNDKN